LSIGDSHLFALELICITIPVFPYKGTTPMMTLPRALFLSTALILSACNGILPRAPHLPDQGNGVTVYDQASGVQTTNLDAQAMSRQVKVAMLLPLSGKDAKLGEAMQNAAQLALGDLGYPNFELVFEDTKSTAVGAAAAAQNISHQGVNLILGPVFADEAKAAKQVVPPTTHIVAFSTDASVAGNGSFIFGILPQDQSRQIANFAASRNLKRVLVITNKDAYGKLVTDSFINTATRHGISIVGTITLDGPITTLPPKLAPYFPATTNATAIPVDAVFMPLPADRAARVSRMLKSLPKGADVTRLGTGLLDDANLIDYPDLVGAYYAAPTPKTRTRFEQAYNRTFSSMPPRLASIGYDATALAIILGRTQGPDGYTAQAISSGNGFTGIDGLFRFKNDGIVERGLAILQLQPGGRLVAAPAPESF
jgi:branched-chain amino acid transport system substrate-binding protein